MDNDILYKKTRIVRVICKYKVGDSFGTGFFLKNGKLLTCFHVIFGQELSNIRNNPEFQVISGNDEHANLEKFYKSKISILEVEFSSGEKVEAELIKFDEKFDIAVLKLKNERKVDFFEVDTEGVLDYDDDIFFCGYQSAPGYTPDKYPFAVNAGQVSSFPDIIVGGEKYTHIQINSINLGGNSGAPLFHKNRNKVVGIVNGNMNWGADNNAFVGPQGNIIKDVFRTPLSIAYVTSMKLLKEESTVFNS